MPTTSEVLRRIIGNKMVEETDNSITNTISTSVSTSIENEVINENPEETEDIADEEKPSKVEGGKMGIPTKSLLFKTLGKVLHIGRDDLSWGSLTMQFVGECPKEINNMYVHRDDRRSISILFENYWKEHENLYENLLCAIDGLLDYDNTNSNGEAVQSQVMKLFGKTAFTYIPKDQWELAKIMLKNPEVKTKVKVSDGAKPVLFIQDFDLKAIIMPIFKVDNPNGSFRFTTSTINELKIEMALKGSKINRQKRKLLY